MKKKLLVLAAAALSLTVAVSGTLAYFTDTGTAHNVITTGGVDVEIVEYSDNAKIEEGQMPDSFKNVMPGTAVSKVVQVENIGGTDAWIRVKVEPVITLNDGTKIAYPDERINVIDIDFNIDDENSDWLKYGDYYYYKNVMQYDAENIANNLTEPLFEEVSFDKQMGNEYQNCRVEIKIISQATQFKNNDPRPTGVTELTAELAAQINGWPADNTTESEPKDETTEEQPENEGNE